MNSKKRDKVIDVLVCYMKKYAEDKGVPIKSVWFDFEQLKPEDVLYNDCKQENNSEEYKALLKLCHIKPNELEEVLKYCKTNEYISGRGFNNLQLTEKGSARATSVMNRVFKLPSWLCKILETIVAPSIVAIISSVITTIIMRKMGG